MFLLPSFSTSGLVWSNMFCTNFIIWLLNHFFSKVIQSVANDFLQRQFRCTSHLSQSEIFRNNFINTQLFHLLDITDQDAAQQLLRQNVHRNELVIFARYYEGTYFTVKIGI